MKLISFNDYRVGVMDGTQAYDLTDALPSGLAAMPRQRMNYLIAHWPELRDTFAQYATRGVALPADTVRLLAPNPAPSQVFAAPSNYQKHLGELGERAVTKKGRTAREQGCFLKGTGSVCGPSSPILLPHGSTRRFDHESELGILIGRTARNVPRAQAMDYVFGYTCLIDLSMRIEKDQFEEERSMRKSFETFTPMGPWIVTADELPDPSALDNRLWVNDSLRQQANTRDMIVGIAELIEMVTSTVTLEPGDVIATGTPDGVGPVQPGDRVRIEIERVGSMTLEVRELAQRAPRAY